MKRANIIQCIASSADGPVSVADAADGDTATMFFAKPPSFSLLTRYYYTRTKHQNYL